MCQRAICSSPASDNASSVWAGVRILWWATLGYIHQQTKQEIRQQWNVAVVTKLKCDMRIIEPFDAWDQMSCQQGQALQWLGYEKADSLHWFGVPAGESLCRCCWEARTCAKEFGYPPELSETLLGLLPLNTVVARRLLNQMRSWIEPCQSLKRIFWGSTICS